MVARSSCYFEQIHHETACWVPRKIPSRTTAAHNNRVHTFPYLMPCSFIGDMVDECLLHSKHSTTSNQLTALSRVATDEKGKEKLCVNPLRCAMQCTKDCTIKWHVHFSLKEFPHAPASICFRCVLIASEFWLGCDSIRLLHFNECTACTRCTLWKAEARRLHLQSTLVLGHEKIGN